jgi:hypothetical protein
MAREKPTFKPIKFYTTGQRSPLDMKPVMEQKKQNEEKVPLK